MKKLTKKDVQFRRKENELLTKPVGFIRGESFVLRNLKNCQVFVPGWFSTVYIDDCFDSNICFGPIESSVFVRDCSNCTISVAAQQVRISTSKDLTVYLFSATNLTLEKADNLVLAPFNFIYPGIHEHFQNSQIDLSVNNGFNVMDFDVEYGQTQNNTNYTLMKKNNFEGFNEYVPDLISQEDFETVYPMKK